MKREISGVIRGSMILGLNENNLAHEDDTKYLHAATTELQQLLPQTMKHLKR